MPDILVQLDNGHGSDTAGKRSPVYPEGQLFEWEFNRDIVKRIAFGLKKIGIKSHILVPELTDVPLFIRAKRSNKLTSRNRSILISVHGNAGGGTGIEVFTTPGLTNADLLAEEFAKSVMKNLPNMKLRADMEDGDLDKEAKFQILTTTACPAILTENGFMDNHSDFLWMRSEAGRKKIAETHIDAIKVYLIRAK